MVLDAPLLFESGLDENCTAVIGLTAPFEVKVERIVKRDGISEETAYSRINIQAKDEFYLNKADVVIENNNQDELEDKLKEALRILNIKEK